MSDVTPTLNIPYILSSQSQKEVTHNEALNIIDTLVQTVVQDKDLAAPPVSPVEGQIWIVATAATGAWAGQEDSLAQYIGGAWNFYTPLAGWRVYITDEGLDAVYNGSGWQVGVANVTAVRVNGNQVVGVQQSAIADASGGTTVDAEARSALNDLLTACRSHGLIAT